MSHTDPLESLNSKAPLIDLDELASTIVDEIMTESMRAQADGVWIRNSFVDPEKEIDTGPERSDVDVFIFCPSWEYPVADTGMALATSHLQLPSAITTSGELDWESKDGKWDDVDAAWEQLPTYAQETLSNSIRHGVYATKEDLENSSARPFDFTIGGQSAYEYLHDPRAQLRIWEGDSRTT